MSGENIIGGNASPVGAANPQLDMHRRMEQAMIEHGKPVKCATEGCDSQTFLPSVQIIKLSAIASPDGQEQVAQANVMVCIKCWQLLNPKQLA